MATDSVEMRRRALSVKRRKTTFFARVHTFPSNNLSNCDRVIKIHTAEPCSFHSVD